MLQNLIKEKIDKLTNDDITNFARKNNIYLKEEETNLIFSVIKGHWYELVYGDFTKIFMENKDKISEENYSKIKDLFLVYKKKYQMFL